jgi:hypothetical protein
MGNGCTHTPGGVLLHPVRHFCIAGHTSPLPLPFHAYLLTFQSPVVILTYDNIDAYGLFVNFHMTHVIDFLTGELSVLTLRPMYLRDLLQQKGIQTPAEFSRQLGISRQHAWLLWHGKTFPSLVTMQRLRDVLHLNPIDLTNLERETPPKQGVRSKPPPPKKRGKPREKE